MHQLTPLVMNSAQLKGVYDLNIMYLENESICTAGCTDTNALNYNLLATVDDSSCKYPEQLLIDCGEVLNQGNYITNHSGEHNSNYYRFNLSNTSSLSFSFDQTPSISIYTAYFRLFDNQNNLL